MEAGFCCSRRSPAGEKSVQRELPPASRMKLPWESEPDKFNRGGVAIPEKAEQKPNMAKKSLSTDPADRAETALYDATSSLSKAKSSVSTAKEELEIAGESIEPAAGNRGKRGAK